MKQFEELYVPEPTTGCWLWTGYICPTGYGQKGTNTLAHRLSYETHIGPIATGNHIHHICETRRCVNPDHLVQLGPGEHLHETLRIHGSTYLWENRRREETHCRRGHEMTPANTHITKDGKKRYCRACIKINNDKRPRKTARRSV